MYFLNCFLFNYSNSECLSISFLKKYCKHCAKHCLGRELVVYNPAVDKPHDISNTVFHPGDKNSIKCMYLHN